MTIKSNSNKDGYIINVTNESFQFKDRKKFQRTRTMLETLKEEHGMKDEEKE